MTTTNTRKRKSTNEYECERKQKQNSKSIGNICAEGNKNTTNSLNQIINKYNIEQPLTAKEIYLDRNILGYGIDYTKYIQLRFDDINSGNIVNKYTIRGWYLLWYLLSSSCSSEHNYIETTINFISADLSMRQNVVREILFKLRKKNIVYFKGKHSSLSNNDRLCVAIDYMQDNNNTNGNGYRAIPVDFVRNILPTITYTQWAIYTYLLVNYSYFSLANYENANKKECFGVSINQYAYPTQEQIANGLDMARTTVRDNIDKLEDNKFKLIKKKTRDTEMYFDEKGRHKLKKENNIYKITLLERVEYVYHHIYKIESMNMKKNKCSNTKKTVNKLLESKGFDYVSQTKYNEDLNNYHYIKYHYRDKIDSYKKVLTNKDTEQYRKMHKKI